MIRVLIVDDSPTAREILKGVLDSDPGIEVVGVAADGLTGVELVEQLEPDLVTMDIEMPVMNGFEATKEIMVRAPTPIVIVSASTRVDEVESAMQAMRAGALTLLRKPVGVNSEQFDQAAAELISTVKAMAEVKVVRHRRPTKPAVAPATPAPAPVRKSSAFGCLAMAASTGGPPALSALIGALPNDFSLPILIVQHIAEGFVDGLARWLDSVVSMRVKIAEADEKVQAGTVYLAPHNYQMGVVRGGRIRLSDDDPIGGFRPAATFLFQSVAETYRDETIAVLLTGMGRDGVDGLKVVRKRGGRTIVQSEDSCVVFGMPGAAVAEGLADAVVPLADMAQHLTMLVRSPKNVKL